MRILQYFLFTFYEGLLISYSYFFFLQDHIKNKVKYILKQSEIRILVTYYDATTTVVYYKIPNTKNPTWHLFDMLVSCLKMTYFSSLTDHIINL